jgi:diguanylate cyclase (GGDEF)-like protein
MEDLSSHSNLDPNIDEQTAVYNTRFFRKVLTWETAQADRYDTVLTMLILDINQLRRVNDDYGYVIGHKILKSLATILKSSLRDVDFVFRTAGDEFTVLLPHTDLEAAMHARNRILIQVKSSDRLAALKLAEQVTVAIGVCEYGRGSSIDQFMKRAAEALSRAKSGNDDDGLTFVRAR